MWCYLCATFTANCDYCVPITVNESGAEGQNRTADTMIFSHVLYRLSYLGVYGELLVDRGF